MPFFRPRPLSVVLASLAVGLGCDWREFDDVLAKAPVLSVGAPSGYKSRDVGKVVLPLTALAGRSDVTARFLVAGTETPSLGLIELDAAGRARTQAASAVEIGDLTGEGKAAVKSVVELTDRRILLGTPAFSLAQMSGTGRVYLLELLDSNGSLSFKLTRGPDPGGGRLGVGLGVAAGKVSGGAAEDWVVASLQDVTVFEDGQATAVPLVSACDLAIDENTPEKYRFRALAIGDFVTGGDQEIAVGVPREAGGRGRVVILGKVGPALECLLTITAPGEQPRFGTALAVADLNDDGKPDLLVGAPPQRAFFYPGPFLPAQGPAPGRELKHPTIGDGSPAGDFGFRLLAFDVDGKAGQEILVSAPELPIGSKTGSGQVYAFRSDGTLLTPLQDYSPEAEASFGLSLAALRFSPSGCGAQRAVLLVGSIREVFAFFRVPEGPPDPRCF